MSPQPQTCSTGLHPGSGVSLTLGLDPIRRIESNSPEQERPILTTIASIEAAEGTFEHAESKARSK